MTSGPSTDWTSSPSLASALVRFQPAAGATEKGLGGLVHEAVERPGGLVRGRLCLQVAAAYAVPAETALRLAAAVEYFHLASLLLDDLPAMDDASERRGAPCAHRLHGEARAILGSMLFVNRAHLLLAEATESSPVPVRRRFRHLLDNALGGRGLCDGQALDLAFDAASGARGVSRVAVGKTVPLLRLSLLLPAVCGGAQASEQLALNRLSVYWGLTYQHLDDLADARSSTEETGKTVGRDAALSRPNLVHAIGEAATLKRSGLLLARADKVLGQLSHRRPALAGAGFWHERLVHLFRSAA